MSVNYIERNQILRGNSGTIYDPNLDIRKNSSTKKVWSVAKLQRERKSICTDLYLRFFPGCCVFFQRKNFNNNVSHSITHLHFIDRLALSLSLSLSLSIYKNLPIMVPFIARTSKIPVIKSQTRIEKGNLSVLFI